MERVRHQLACANCMLANTNLPVNKDYHFLSSLNKNDTSSLNDFDTLDMCIIYYLL